MKPENQKPHWQNNPLGIVEPERGVDHLRPVTLRGPMGSLVNRPVVVERYQPNEHGWVKYLVAATLKDGSAEGGTAIVSTKNGSDQDKIMQAHLEQTVVFLENPEKESAKPGRAQIYGLGKDIPVISNDEVARDEEGRVMISHYDMSAGITAHWIDTNPIATGEVFISQNNGYNTAYLKVNPNAKNPEVREDGSLKIHSNNSSFIRLGKRNPDNAKTEKQKEYIESLNANIDQLKEGDTASVALTTWIPQTSGYLSHVADRVLDIKEPELTNEAKAAVDAMSDDKDKESSKVEFDEIPF